MTIMKSGSGKVVEGCSGNIRDAVGAKKIMFALTETKVLRHKKVKREG